MGYFKNRSNVGTATHIVKGKKIKIYKEEKQEVKIVKFLDKEEYKEKRKRLLEQQEIARNCQKLKQKDICDIASCKYKIMQKVVLLSPIFADEKARKKILVPQEAMFYHDVLTLIQEGILPNDILEEFWIMSDKTTISITPRCFNRICSLLK